MGDDGGTTGARAFLIPIAFLALVVFFLWDPWPLDLPIPVPVRIPSWAVDTSPVRTPALRPVTRVAAYEYRCSECHALFPSPPETDRPLTQHRQIHLDHGINNRCFNCHLRGDRNALANDRGEPIRFAHPQELCAKCHGPVYRDWTHGVHGRSEGYWNTSLGPMVRRKCIECHDPHQPAFRSLRPAPPPETLRMGDQTIRGREERAEMNPLLIYRQRGALGNGVTDGAAKQDHSAGGD